MNKQNKHISHFAARSREQLTLSENRCMLACSIERGADNAEEVQQSRSHTSEDNMESGSAQSRLDESIRSIRTSRERKDIVQELLPPPNIEELQPPPNNTLLDKRNSSHVRVNFRESSLTHVCGTVIHSFTNTGLDDQWEDTGDQALDATTAPYLAANGAARQADGNAEETCLSLTTSKLSRLLRQVLHL
jgi:hypothetical protein